MRGYKKEKSPGSGDCRFDYQIKIMIYKFTLAVKKVLGDLFS